MWNELKVQMLDSIRVIAITSRRPGRVTFQKRCQALAPSIAAASYSSVGIAASPARNIMM